MITLLRYTSRYVLAIWLVLTVNFVLVQLMPGDAATTAIARLEGRVSPESIRAVRELFGQSERPIHQAYATYLVNLLQGKLGTSISHFPRSVHSVIADALVWTLVLTGSATVVAIGLGTLLGIFAAWRPGGWIDSIGMPAAVFFGAFPYFWFALLLLYIFGYRLDWFPVRHAYDVTLEPDSCLDSC